MPDADVRLAAVIAAIDAANARDPNRIDIDGSPEPAALCYGWRMSDTLARMAPDASLHLRIAARGQHIERWTTPRTNYPAGRAGYLGWRNHLKVFHAKRIGEIMAAAGFSAGDIARVGALVRKERLKRETEAQMLEDVACVVFLAYYVGDVMAKADDDKLAGILARTWHKMSPFGHEHALRLPLPPTIPRLLKQGLAGAQDAGAQNGDEEDDR